MESFLQNRPTHGARRATSKDEVRLRPVNVRPIAQDEDDTTSYAPTEMRLAENASGQEEIPNVQVELLDDVVHRIHITWKDGRTLVLRCSY